MKGGTGRIWRQAEVLAAITDGKTFTRGDSL